MHYNEHKFNFNECSGIFKGCYLKKRFTTLFRKTQYGIFRTIS